MKLNTKDHTSILYPGELLNRQVFFWLALISLLGFLSSCNNNNRPPKKEIVETPKQMNEMVPDVIKKLIGQANDNNGKMDDSISVWEAPVLQYLYEKNGYSANWSKEEHWTPTADSLIYFIEHARLYGLFPEDYHLPAIAGIRQRILNDSLSATDAVLWARADVLLTDALVQIIKDVKLGRLQKDSITLRPDSAITNEFYEQQLQQITQSFAVARIINTLEPSIKAYQELKSGIVKFLDSADFKNYTYVPYPVYDSAKFKQALQQRLLEEGVMDSAYSSPGMLQLSGGIKKYQEKKKLKSDGKAGSETIRSLNLTDKNKFLRIAISLDKYKMLPATMPVKFLWINLAGFYLQLWENDTVKIQSKIVVGKPLTRTPELNSAVSEMITYPQWTIPESIIAKEILPALKKDPGYLEKKGYSLLDVKNEEVDPYFVDWTRYKTTIPFKVVQGSGDANALGIMKFNFPNKYAVYLHDTNQRYLFAQASRALSHGCVRVQEWQKLTDYILRNDSMSSKSSGNGWFIKADSVVQWLKKKEKHYIPVKNKIPLFIRYFTCEGHDGKIVFYDDIYNEDQRLRERFFAGK